MLEGTRRVEASGRDDVIPGRVSEARAGAAARYFRQTWRSDMVVGDLVSG